MPGDSDELENRPAAADEGDGLDDLELDDDDDDDGPLGDLPKAVRQRIESFIPELVKKTFTAGMGAVFTTEDQIRRVTKDMKMPKEVAGYMVNAASSTKDELMRIMAREVRDFLQTVNVSEEIAKMLTLLSFEVKTEIRFIPNDEKYGGVEPDVKASVSLKRNDKAEPRRKRRSMRRRKSEDEDAEDES